MVRCCSIYPVIDQEIKKVFLERARPGLFFTEKTLLSTSAIHLHPLSLQFIDESHGLDWKTRYKIIKGACQGLKYLHEGNGLRKPIYHLDLKPDNILLDENMTPKLADFGLSKLCVTEQTQVTQDALGTM
jgi:serine/threonine protein kinase